MVKKKTVKNNSPWKKAAPKKTAAKKVVKKVAQAKQADSKVESPSLQETVVAALNNLLELAKANIYDSFRAYVQHKIDVNLPAHLEDFLRTVEKILAVLGIGAEELFNQLKPHQQEYLMKSAKAAEAGAVPAKAVPLDAPVTAVKPSGVKPVSEQATKINSNEFGLGEPAAVGKAQVAAAAQPSVLSALDVL